MYSSESVGETRSCSGTIRWELEYTNGFVSTELRAGREAPLLWDSADAGEVYLEGGGMDGELSSYPYSTDWGLLMSR